MRTQSFMVAQYHGWMLAYCVFNASSAAVSLY